MLLHWNKVLQSRTTNDSKFFKQITNGLVQSPSLLLIKLLVIRRRILLLENALWFREINIIIIKQVDEVESRKTKKTFNPFTSTIQFLYWFKNLQEDVLKDWSSLEKNPNTLCISFYCLCLICACKLKAPSPLSHTPATKRKRICQQRHNDNEANSREFLWHDKLLALGPFNSNHRRSAFCVKTGVVVVQLSLEVTRRGDGQVDWTDEFPTNVHYSGMEQTNQDNKNVSG